MVGTAHEKAVPFGMTVPAPLPTLQRHSNASGNDMISADHANRRQFLIGAASLAGGLITVLPVTDARATPETMQAAIKKVVGSAALRKGKVTLRLPPLVENGNSVAMDVAVESPMTADDYVRAIHVFNEKNPQSNVVSVRLGPPAGQAKLSTRVRLADSQRIMAIAEMNDGSFWSDEVDVIVTIAACLEDPV
jgi:sulfur-oxidizing protein SoxY